MTKRKSRDLGRLRDFVHARRLGQALDELGDMRVLDDEGRQHPHHIVARRHREQAVLAEMIDEGAAVRLHLDAEHKPDATDAFEQMVVIGDHLFERAAITEHTAAILVEPVQGEGGVRAPSADYLKGLRAICDEFGLLLVYDEVQSGMGRTGRLFAHEWAGVAPDIMAVAKALGNGFPIGACLATEKAAGGMVAGTHGSTFGGNPMAVAAGNAVLDVMLEPGFFDSVNRTAKLLWGKLEGLVAAHPKLFVEVRGSGHLLGVRCRSNVTAGDFVTKLRAEGLICLTAGDNVLRILPPLIVSESEIDEGMAILNKVAREWPQS